jgi:hypothetical protein
MQDFPFDKGQQTRERSTMFTIESKDLQRDAGISGLAAVMY